MHNRLIEHYIRTSNDWSVLGVLESVSNFAVWSIAKETTFPGPQFEFSGIVFWYEGICLAFENPKLVVRLNADP